MKSIENSERSALVLGTGGEARVVISLLRSLGYRIHGLLDCKEYREGEVISGVSVVGNASDVSSWTDTLGGPSVFLAIGNNEERASWYQFCKSAGLNTPSIIARSSSVDDSAELGEANIVCEQAHVGSECFIGNNNIINSGAIVEHESMIGDHVHCAPSSTVCGRSKLGDLCFLGASSVVIEGLELAAKTTLGAGAVLVDSVTETGLTMLGIPAKPKTNDRA